MEGMDHFIFDWGGGCAIFFCGNIFSSLITIGDLRLNFISLACNIFICFVLLCTIFISSAKAVQEIFAFAQPPLKNKMVRQAETRQCYLSHTVSAFAFSIIS